MLYSSQQMVFNSPCLTHKKELIHHEDPALSWLVQKQTALGKETSNPLMADNLPKIVWYSTHHITCMKSWLVQKQTALGKDTSNPLIVDSLLKTIWFSIQHHLTIEVLDIPRQTATGVNTPRSDEDRLKHMELMVFLMQKGVCDELELSAARLLKFLLSGKCIICLPNDEIFAGLARMGYEKPSTKLTFYKAFFSSQWKFFIHTLLHSLSAKRTSWNEFSSAMASALICLSTGQRFNFSKYIFESLVRNVDSTSKFYIYPRVGKGFSGVETPLFENMLEVRAIDAEEEVQNVTEAITDEVVTPTPISPSPPSHVIPSSPPYQSPSPPPTQAAEGSSHLVQQVLDKCSALVLRVEGLETANTAQQLEILKLKARDVENVFNQRRKSVDMETNEGIELEVDQEKYAEVEGRQADTQAEIFNIDLDHSFKVLSMQEDTEVQEAVEVVTTTKLITKVVTAAATQVVAASTPIPAAKAVVAAASTPIPAAKPKVLKIAAATPDVSTRKRKGVVIRDPEEELHTETPAETLTVKDKGKGFD
nr:glutamic acid-rich protein-like [Tanacetum cinerariifolium]